MSVPFGFCECGCGERTSVAPQTCRDKGWIKDKPIRFVRGHSSRVLSPFRAGHHINRGRKMPPRSEAHCLRLSAAKTGKKRTPESIASQKAAWAAKSYEERLSVSSAGRKKAKPVGQTEALRRWWTGLTIDQRADVKEKRKAGQRSSWAALTDDGKFARTEPGRVLATAASSRTRPTSIERSVASVLDALGVSYLSQVPFGKYVADFVIPERKLIIECDGDYWHSRPGIPERDRKRDDWLNAQGYTVVRLWERAIRRGAALGAIKAVLEVA